MRKNSLYVSRPYSGSAVITHQMLTHEFASMRLMAGPASLLVQFVRIISFSGGTNGTAQ